MQAISEHQRLIKQRNNLDFWTENIIDAHHKCKSKADETLFYMYLTTPRDEFNPNIDVSKVKTLGDRMDEEDWKDDIQPLPANLTQDFYKNGHEITIRTRRNDLLAIEEDDEKAPMPSLRRLALGSAESDEA